VCSCTHADTTLLLSVCWYFCCIFQHNITRFYATLDFCAIAVTADIPDKVADPENCFFWGGGTLESLKCLLLLTEQPLTIFWAFDTYFVQLRSCFNALWKLTGTVYKPKIKETTTWFGNVMLHACISNCNRVSVAGEKLF